MHEPAQRLLEHIQHYPNCIKGLLLDLAAAAVLIATTLKANGTVTVQLQCGKGPNAINFAFVNIDNHSGLLRHQGQFSVLDLIAIQYLPIAHRFALPTFSASSILPWSRNRMRVWLECSGAI